MYTNIPNCQQHGHQQFTVLSNESGCEVKRTLLHSPVQPYCEQNLYTFAPDEEDDLQKMYSMIPLSVRQALEEEMRLRLLGNV